MIYDDAIREVSMKSIWIIVLAVLIVAASGAYFSFQPLQQSTYTPSILRIGVLPDQNLARLRTRISPLLDYLAEETGLEVKLTIASDYSHLLQLFGNNEVDMARFGGLGFVQANAFYHAKPLVMRDIDTRFVSWFLVREDSAVQSITDTQGKPFSFGNHLSTSGHLMPRHFLKINHQIVPEEFFSEVRYSSAHDETVYSILNDEVALGSVNPIIVKEMIEDGRLEPNALRILWETPPYPDYVWAIHNTLESKMEVQLRNIFLALDPVNEQHIEILNNLHSSGFLPAGVHDFSLLKEIALSLGLLESSNQ